MWKNHEKPPFLDHIPGNIRKPHVSAPLYMLLYPLRIPNKILCLRRYLPPKMREASSEIMWTYLQFIGYLTQLEKCTRRCCSQKKRMIIEVIQHLIHNHQTSQKHRKLGQNTHTHTNRSMYESSQWYHNNHLCKLVQIHLVKNKSSYPRHPMFYNPWEPIKKHPKCICHGFG